MSNNRCRCVLFSLPVKKSFAISIKDLEFQPEKEARLETNLNIVIQKKYQNFLDLFLKKNLNIISSY